MKHVLITGASSGIGLEIANLLSEDNNVFLSGRRTLNKDNYFACDLAEPANAEKLYNSAKDYFKGNIDVLVNCAGQYIYNSIENTSYKELDYLTNLNFKASYLLAKLVICGMKENKWGRIVNIGSISGMVGEGNAALYSATKAALSGFTRALALEVAQYNITVNQINPGWVDTPLANILSEDERKEVVDVTPQKRFVEPIEVAKLAQYLISDSAKGITGQNINICAGLSIGC